MNRINLFFSETWTELVHKVSWPTLEDLQGSLIVVTIAMLILALIVWVMNEAANFAMHTFYHFFQ
ncbi:MAG TPA: preprotein translocase subunit SecE [Chitinophagales bacterium]|nr:preprotein translocase subunit SecE [Chitinophagales bacterium]